MKQLKRTTFNLEVRADDSSMEFEGIANGFHSIDAYGCIMARGAFQSDLDAFLRDGFIGGINHDWSKPIGKPLSAREDDIGLATRGKISDTEAGREVHTLMKDGVISFLSIGFRILDSEYLESAEAVESYWEQSQYKPSDDDIRNSRYGALLMKRVRLYEYSPVMFPGNALTAISDVRNAPLAGQPMDDHLNAVLAADEELLVRIETLVNKRSEEGRTLSAMWKGRLARLCDHYGALLQTATAGAVDLTQSRSEKLASAQDLIGWLEANN